MSDLNMIAFSRYAHCLATQVALLASREGCGVWL